MSSALPKPAGSRKNPPSQLGVAVDGVFWSKPESPRANDPRRIRSPRITRRVTSTDPPPIPYKHPARQLVCGHQDDFNHPDPLISPTPLRQSSHQVTNLVAHRVVKSPSLIANDQPADSPGRRLLATRIFEDTLSDCPSPSLEMASSRFSTFVDPAFARFSRLPMEHPFRAYQRREAQKAQAVIHKRLEAAGEPMPPYEWLQYIGKGSYGRVYMAQDLEAQKPVSLKVLDVDAADYKANTAHRDLGLNELTKEYQVLKQLEGIKAENVNQVLDVRVVHSQIWIITEYVPGGSVHTLMQATNGKVEEKYIRIIARELAKGLRAIHKADIIHRDIKAGNVMVHLKGAIEIIDFGVAGQLESAVDKRATFIGTPHWMSPEILEDNNTKYGKEVDTWSYGCTLIEMATGNGPNNRVPIPNLAKRLRLQNGPKLKAQDGYSQELCDLVAFVLVLDPSKRPSMDEILEHPYLRDTEDEYPTRLLADFAENHERWLATGGQRMSLIQPYGAEAAEYHEDPSTKDEWRFSTLDTGALDETAQTSSMNYGYAGSSTDPVADMTSAQAQEDTMNSYFAGGPPDEDLGHFSNSDYTPGPSPRSFYDGPSSDPAETTVPNETSVQRGGGHLGALFDPNASDYTSPALQKKTPKSKQHDSQRGQSDLPLRSRNASSTDLQRSDTETSSQGSFRSNKKISKIDTVRANNYARPTTMDWDFPQKAPAPSSTMPSLPTLQSESSGTSHPNLSDWTPGYESDVGPPPSRPPLRHAETAPAPHDITRGSRLDMDALMGDLGDTYAYAPPEQPTFQGAPMDMAETDDGSLDLDAMMGDFTPRNEPYHNASGTDNVETAATAPLNFPIPAPPSVVAMAIGASDDVVEAELKRMIEGFGAGLEALGAQFAQFDVDDEYESTDGEGNESE